MQFFAPLWLALGAAAAVPLLLHLWNRRRSGERVLFPPVRLLTAATEARGAAIRLREWILLALRVLAVVLLAAAAAQPSVSGRVGARAPAAVALVLDNSLSTSAVVDGRPVLDALRGELRAALAGLTPGDRVWLLTADGRVVAGDVATVRAALDAVRPLAGAGEVPAALRRAAGLVAAARARGEHDGGVVVATDAQATTWPRPVTVAGVRVGVVRARGDAPADRAVAALRAEPARWSPEGAVIGRLTAAGDWHFALRDSAGRVVTEARGTAVAADSFDARVVLRPTARGWLAGTLDLAPDELRGDDARHVAVFVGPPPQLAADPSAGPFAAAGVTTLTEARAVGAAPGGSSAGAPPLISEPQASTRLPAILVAPADPARLAVANRALDRLGVPWRYAASVALPTTAAFRAGSSVPVLRRWRLEPRAPRAADTLAAVAGEPWIVAGDGYVLLASPLDTTWTRFPARAAFLPWLMAAATRLADPGRVATRPQMVAPGAVVPVPAGADALLGPAGARPVGDVRITAPARPGVYFWLRTGARVGALVVDPEAEEVVLARLDAKGMGDRVRVGAGGAVDVGTSGADARAFVLGAGGRRSLAPLLAAVAVLLLGGEAIAARSRAAA
ncbi:hypothetical protein tb265_34050 [Gemmatimonadetes bacterium T265]|nr:hypothetical protein tb265_34050 [Gemmatimonadetes bacterium T265]